MSSSHSTVAGALDGAAGRKVTVTRRGRVHSAVQPSAVPLSTIASAGALDGLRPATGVPNLYVTGQDVGTVGIVGALNGGILTAHAVLGYGFWDLVLAKVGGARRDSECDGNR